MTLYRNRKRSDLAAIDGKKFNLDLLMTGISFILLFIFAVIPIAMIAYNAFFLQRTIQFEAVYFGYDK